MDDARAIWLAFVRLSPLVCPPSSFRQPALHVEGRVAKHPVTIGAPRSARCSWIPASCALHGSALTRLSGAASKGAAPNCRIGVTLLRFVDDDRAQPAHAKRAPIVQCFERLN